MRVSRAALLGSLAALLIGVAFVRAISQIGSLPDVLTADARSPDGALYARSWCTNGCDVDDTRTITVSHVERNVGLRREGEGLEGDMPDDDVVGRVSIEPDPELSLRWTAPRTLRVEGPCLRARGGGPQPPARAGEAEVRFVSTPGARPCTRPEEL